MTVTSLDQAEDATYIELRESRKVSILAAEQQSPSGLEQGGCHDS